jgi:integrase
MRTRSKPSIYSRLTAVERDALRKMSDLMKVQHKALSTRRGYLSRVAWYMLFIRTRLRPGLTRKERIEAWLTDFATRRRAAATQNQAFNAIKFFFEDVYKIPMGEIDALRAKVPKRLRIPPERDDVVRMLAKVRNTAQCRYRTLTFLLYGMGLRISEAYGLRIKDVLVNHSKIVIREGKGKKDRLLTVPCNLMPAILAQLDIADRIWRIDSENRVPVPLHNALAIKYPANPLKRDWAWLFPAPNTCFYEGRTMRYHISGQSIREVIASACHEAGIERLTPHVLRHGFASDFQGDIQLLQKVMGHKNIETTIGYRHLRNHDHPSPIDGLVVA